MVVAKDLVKTYVQGKVSTPVLRGISLTVARGEFVAIMGRSGAGKSTLLYQLGLLDHCTSGSIALDGVETTSLSSLQRTEFRLRRLGYIFQDYALVPELTALENVALPLLMLGRSKAEAYATAEQAIANVGLGDRARGLPSQLSGGEQQRVSIARAVAHRPAILFADEPTANLDTQTSDRVLEIFRQLNDAGQTIVMVTHEPEYGRLADRIIHISDGRVVSR